MRRKIDTANRQSRQAPAEEPAIVCAPPPLTGLRRKTLPAQNHRPRTGMEVKWEAAVFRHSEADSRPQLSRRFQCFKKLWWRFLSRNAASTRECFERAAGVRVGRAILRVPAPSCAHVEQI